MAKDTARSLSQAIEARLIEGALPGELEGFDADDRSVAAAFVAETAATRTPATPNLALESFAHGEARRMRLAVVNDDMPFLVDSIAAAIAAHDIAIHRIIHPVLAVTRDANGTLTGVEGGAPESFLYIETDRVDARQRRALTDAIVQSLSHVRMAVADWGAMRAAMRADADTIADPEGAALLRWFEDGNMTLLGATRWRRSGSGHDALGLARDMPVPLLSLASRALAVEWFARGGAAPLLLKSNFLSTVHRRAPLDLAIVPIVHDGAVEGLSIHAGLWTSTALHADSDEVPVLRSRLAKLQRKFGFDPRGHTGKALEHALTGLPHDLTTVFAPAGLATLALTSMSVADRPRPQLILLTDPLRRHLFAFVWLPRDELSTARRVAIGHMLEEAADATLLSWSIGVEDGQSALLRYMLDIRGGHVPDAAVLHAQVERMVRGWVPAVEAALVGQVGARGTRLALRFAGGFPLGYRNAADPEEAARDIVRIGDLADEHARSVRFCTTTDASMRIKLYRLGGALPLSDAVPVFENFGFRVIEEVPTRLTGEGGASIHDFQVALASGAPTLAADASVVEAAIAAVLEGHAENDAFNRLIVEVGIAPAAIVLLRAWYRYLRQTGLAYSLATVVEALRRAPGIANALVARFAAAHDPAAADAAAIEQADAAIDAGLAKVAAIDDDRILRALHGLVRATLRTNAYAPAAAEALAFKLDSGRVPNLPAPRPWREIWVYSPRVEGIHLRAGPVARGGIRWSDRRDDFRTEILGLMKAQRVKNAVIVPTGAKGGFYPKQLPAPTDRDAWMAEGTESYRIFIRALLSLTDNIVEDKVVHPDAVTILDGEDPYFVVAADKGTATFSDVANAIALERGFWLGDAFASGGSVGYDHKAMGITARGGWISVQRHFLEMGVDVQSDPVRVVGCGDMSGDVFGNGMLLSRAIKLTAAFDHRHIFLDPDPDPAKSWAERNRLFALPRSSWADYDPALLGAGGGVFARSEKIIRLTPQVQALLGTDAPEMEPAQLVSAILTAPVDLIWFGGIGTYIKAAAQPNIDVGDPANDRLRVNAESVRAKVVGEGANLGVTQAARIAYGLRGGRINTDFIDNSAGVDCSDNEVNIKIALNREMIEGRLEFADRNTFLASMTDDVAGLVLEDNRLQTLALSFMENDGAMAVPSYIRVIEILEAAGRLDRAVEGLAANEDLLRRAQDHAGLTRPELAVLLATAKLALQDAVENSALGMDAELLPDLHAAFPQAMRERFGTAIDAHRLRPQIVATKLANRIVNRLGVLHPFELAEEEGAAMADIAAMFVVAERLFDLPSLWAAIESATIGEDARLALFEEVAGAVRTHMADLLRAAPPGADPGAIILRLEGGIDAIDRHLDELLRDEARAQGDRITARLSATGAPADLVARVVRLVLLDGAIGLSELGQRSGVGEEALARAFINLGHTLGLDWAQTSAARITSGDPWERLLIAGLARDFQQLRLEFLARMTETDPEAAVDRWLHENEPRVAQFNALVDRARKAAIPSSAMLAQIAGQARVLLGR